MLGSGCLEVCLSPMLRSIHSSHMACSIASPMAAVCCWRSTLLAADTGSRITAIHLPRTAGSRTVALLLTPKSSIGRHVRSMMSSTSRCAAKAVDSVDWSQPFCHRLCHPELGSHRSAVLIPALLAPRSWSAEVLASLSLATIALLSPSSGSWLRFSRGTDGPPCPSSVTPGLVCGWCC